MDDRRALPLLVLISGAPGSGKSTLAAELAAALGLPRLSRDELWSGLRFTHARGAPAIVATRGIAAEYGALEHLLAVGVSVVADGTLYSGEMEGNIRRLCDLADVVKLHCMSVAALDRYRQTTTRRRRRRGGRRRHCGGPGSSTRPVHLTVGSSVSTDRGVQRDGL